METSAQPQKRPTGMTILLVLSFINACWNILRSFIMFIMTPQLGKMLDSGQFEEMMEPFSSMGDDFINSMTESMTLLSQISPYYYLILLVLFVGSLIGVIKMFKSEKRGLHVYAVSQILMLINASVFLYPKQAQSTFVTDLLFTAIFILLYYMYFRRMEASNDNSQSTDLP